MRKLLDCSLMKWHLKNDEVTKADDIQKKWLLMKETWLKGSKQVCDERSTSTQGDLVVE